MRKLGRTCKQRRSMLAGQVKAVVMNEKIGGGQSGIN